LKTLIVYDSMYGNTEMIAKAVAEGITGDVNVKRVGDVKSSDFDEVDLLITGSPTQGGRHTKPMEAFLNGTSGKIKKTTRIAVFDTRMPAKWVKIFGYAAGKMADYFKKEGFELVVSPEPFWVESARGPLKAGERERAVDWGKNISRALNG